MAREPRQSARLHRLHGEAERLAELHEGVALFRRAAQTDEVDILGHATWSEPQRDERAANQQPLSVEPIRHSIQDRLDAHAVLESAPKL